MKEKEIELLNDQAFGESGSPQEDGLGFKTYAEVLASAALGTTGPFTIGIFGEWGTGKTSLMHMIQESLSTKPDVITVWFNAWRFEKEEHPIVPLVATIVRELQLKKHILAKLADEGKSLVTALRAVAYGFSSKAKVKLPGFAEIEAAFVAKDMIDRSEKLSPDPLLDRSLYYEAFETLSNIDIADRLRIVVLIDDLDRCFPDLAIKMLESIKLVLSQPGFVFVLGVSRSVIEGYLEHRYEEEYGLHDFKGRSYLDKIVQLPFYIPPHRGRMKEFSDTLLERIEQDDREALQEILPIVAAAAGSNPRSTIRFVNNLLIDRAINALLAKAGSMEIVPIGYFAVSRSLQQRWGDMFSLLVRSEDLCSNIATWKREQIATYTSSSNKDEIDAAKMLVSDRDLQDLIYSDYGQAWLQDGTRRSAAIQFLRTQRPEIAEDESAFDALFVFSDKDLETASTIAGILAQRGIRSYLGPSATPGTDRQQEPTAALSKSKAVIVLISLHWTQPTEAEETLIRNAIDGSLPIIPVLLPGAVTSSLPPYMKSRTWLDVTEENLTEQALSPLIAALEALKYHTPLRSPTPPATTRDQPPQGTR